MKLFSRNIRRFIKQNYNFQLVGKPAGYDRVRNAEIGVKNVTLHVVDEAYTTEHWLVRIYRVKDYDNRGGRMKPNKVSTYYKQ